MKMSLLMLPAVVHLTYTEVVLMPDRKKGSEYVRKYQTEKTDTVVVRPPKGTKDSWKKAAEKLGMSTQRFVIEVVNKEIKRLSEE